MNKDFQDLLADTTEVVFDTLCDNEIVKQIPILGSSLKIIRGFQSLSDKIYLNKIKIFIDRIGQVTENQKQRIVIESRKSEKSRAKFGDAIFTAIEQSDSVVKIEYIAIAFEAFLNNDFEESDLRLLCHIIRNTFSDELVDIIENDTPATNLKYIVASGLAEASYSTLKFDGNAEPKYNLSGSAEQLRAAWRKYNTKNTI